MENYQGDELIDLDSVMYEEIDWDSVITEWDTRLNNDLEDWFERTEEF